MRKFLQVGVLTGVFVGTLFGATIPSIVINLNAVNGLNQPLYRYVYDLTGLTLGLDQELRIHFEASRFVGLFNGVAPTDGTFIPLLFNDPSPGADSTYHLRAFVANPSMVGPFGVDVAYLGSGVPADQIFYVNQLNQQGGLVRQLDAGFTSTSTAPGPGAVPEPGTMMLVLGLLLFIYLARRRPLRSLTS